MRLLTMTLQEIDAEVKKLENESKALRKNIYKTAWFMRGALDMESAFGMDVSDLEILSEIVKENLETTKESGLPFF
jgi:hypothetical protein